MKEFERQLNHVIYTILGIIFIYVILHWVIKLI